MKKILVTGLALACLVSFSAYADDASSSTPSNNGDWTGSGEIGFASTTGNTHSQNADAKLNLKQETEQWKNTFFLDALRQKSQVSVINEQGNSVNQYDTTANRYDVGASFGYKLDPRSYIVTAARYDHDDFAANTWQGTISVGYGYVALKNDRTELSFEIGPGYTEYQPASSTIVVNNVTIPYSQGRQEEAIARGLVNYKYQLTDNTAFTNTFLMEAGSKNKYYQDDAGLQVTITKKLALKVGYEVRHNSNVLPGIHKNDTLATTNAVYNF